MTRALLTVLVIAVTACSSTDNPVERASTQPGSSELRLGQIADAVDAWSESATLDETRAHNALATC